MGVLYIDKPKGITSFDVCFKLRKVLGTKKIGHTGTLDPNATGLMVVLFEKDTKANQFLVTDTKEYIGTCLLGIETDSEDIDGKIIRECDCLMPDEKKIKEVLNSFLGKSKQLPPMTSAIKVNGKKLYEYQREGKSVEIEERDIEVFEIELLSISEKEFTFRALVSSGTYIRSLLRDILKKLNVIGTLKELRRTKIDSTSIEKADNFDDVLKGNYHVYDLYDILSKKYETVEVSDIKPVTDGKPLKLNSLKEEVLICNNNKCIAIYYKDKGVYRSKRGLF